MILSYKEKVKSEVRIRNVSGKPLYKSDFCVMSNQPKWRRISHTSITTCLHILEIPVFLEEEIKAALGSMQPEQPRISAPNPCPSLTPLPSPSLRAGADFLYCNSTDVYALPTKGALRQIPGFWLCSKISISGFAEAEHNRMRLEEPTLPWHLIFPHSHIVLGDLLLPIPGCPTILTSLPICFGFGPHRSSHYFHIHSLFLGLWF